MNKEQLTRKLNSVGREVFVQYFDLFKDHAGGRITKEEAIERLVADKISNENGADIRCSNAKLIFEANMECRAVGMICDNWRKPNYQKILLIKQWSYSKTSLSKHLSRLPWHPRT